MDIEQAIPEAEYGEPEVEAEKPTDPGMSPEKLAEFWLKEIAASEKWLEKFHANGKKIENTYLSEGNDESSMNGRTHFNLFWSNIQVLMAATYSKLPSVDVSRKFKDFEDDVSRVAGIMIQRIINSDTFSVNSNTDETFKNVLIDRFVPGLGQAWCRYDFDETKQIDPLTGEEVSAISNETAPIDHIRWEDFLFSPCRTWTERRWVARKHYFTKDKLDEKFGEKIASQISMSLKTIHKGSNEDAKEANPEDQAVVIEIWCNDSKRVYWYSKGCPVILHYQDDPLELDGFFPCPKPLVGTVTTKNFIPRPEYVILQDQYKELEMVTKRITLLSEALRVVGCYDKEVGVLSKMLNGDTNTMVPVENWALFSEKGGVKGAVDWFPLEMVSAALEKLTARKRELMTEIYEILGISDLMRGSTKASETATAQKLKAQFGGARVDTMQKGIAKFMSEVMQIRGEIIGKHWQKQSIISQSGIDKTPDARYADAAVELLKKSGTANSKLEVLSETIAAPDWEAEKQQRTEFLQGVSQFIGMSMPLIEKDPGAVPFLVKIIQWAAAGFQSGKTLEGVLDQALQSLEMSAKQPKEPPPPPPEIIKANIDKESAKEIEGMKLQAAGQRETQKLSHEQEIARIKAEQETQQNLAEMAHKERLAEIEAQRDIALEQIKQENENLRAAEELQVEMMGGSLVKKAEMLITTHQAKCEAKETAKAEVEAEAESGEEVETPDISNEMKELLAIIAAPKKIVRDAQGNATIQVVKGAA